MGAGGGGVHAGRGQVRLPSASGLGDHTLQQYSEDAGVPPRPEAAVDRRPRAELAGQLPPLAAGAEPPDHPLELFPQPLGVRAVLAYRQERLDQLPLLIGECLRVTIAFLPDSPFRRIRIGRIDHNITQALVRAAGCRWRIEECLQDAKNE